MSIKPDPNCPDCHGTGERDSGGTHPWGAPAMVACDCYRPDANDLYTALDELLTANSDGKDPEAYWSAVQHARNMRDRYRTFQE